MVDELIAVWDFGQIKGQPFRVEIHHMSDEHEEFSELHINGKTYPIHDLDREMRNWEREWSRLTRIDTDHEQLTLGD